MKEFCKKHNITECQFLGIEKIKGNLDLSLVTSLPEGFNPIVGGWLDLHSVKSLPEGFNPTVGGSLNLASVTSLPEGFNPTVRYGVYPESLNVKYTQLPENYMFSWQNGKYIMVDMMFAEVISRHLNVWKCKGVNTEKTFYIVTDGIRYAHGGSIEEARESLKYKIGDRDFSRYKGLSVDTEMGFYEMVECYRVITGACEYGVKEFLKRKDVEERRYTISDVIEMTASEYAGDIFKKFFITD